MIIPQIEPITTTIVSGVPVSNANTNLNDPKVKAFTDKKLIGIAPNYTYESRQIENGNLEAGQIANAYYIPWSATTRAFDSLKSSQFNKNHSMTYYFLTGPDKSEQISSRQAQQIGYELPSNTLFVPNMSTSDNKTFLYNNLMRNK